LDIFRAVRKAVEAVTGRTFGFRIHCGESVPFPLGDLHRLHASTSDDLESTRRLHIAIEEMCVQQMFNRSFKNGASLESLCASLAVVRSGVCIIAFSGMYRCWCALTDGTIPAELLRELLLCVKDARKIEDADFMTTHCRLRFGHGSALAKHADPSPSEKDHDKSEWLVPRLMYHQLIGSSAFVVEPEQQEGDALAVDPASASDGARFLPREGDAGAVHGLGQAPQHTPDRPSRDAVLHGSPGAAAAPPAPPPAPIMTVATSRQASTVDASKFSHTPVLKKGNLERHDIRTAENPFVPVEVCQSSNLYLLPPKVCVCVHV
jgi:hypothetical protein